MKERDLVHIALENLEKATQYKGTWKEAENTNNDGTIEFDINGKLIKVNVEIKKELRNHHLQNIFQRALLMTPMIVIANNIFPNLKKELRENHIGYIEACGNAYLKIENILIWIEGRKILKVEKETTNRAFTKTGLKVVFIILQNEELINKPYRELARIAEVGLGNINYIFKGLKETGFLIRLNKDNYKLGNKKELLDRWLTGYAERLRPTLEIGTFRFLKNEDFINWGNLHLQNKKTYWGGEPAGNKLTNYLRPEILTLYTTEPRHELIKHYRMVPDPGGNIKIFRKFWHDDVANLDLAPPLLIYTDLVNTGDDRCIETANMIFDEFFKEKYDS